LQAAHRQELNTNTVFTLTLQTSALYHVGTAKLHCGLDGAEFQYVYKAKYAAKGQKEKWHYQVQTRAQK
jgi:hypothetical protein